MAVAFLKVRFKANRVPTRMRIQGTMSFQEIEGGFWGVIAHDGARYVPVDPVPEQFKQDGLRVNVTVRPASVLGTTMWGSYVHVDTIEMVK